MSAKKSELTKKQMENVKGGIVMRASILENAHCKACGGRMAPYGSYYRCITPDCEERGKDKDPSEVNWY